MYKVMIEIHATPSNYWGKMQFVDKTGNLHEKSFQGGQKATANSNALQSAIHAVGSLNRACVLDIHTDSDYLIGAIRQKWVNDWQQNGWKTAKGTPVKNVEQWQKLMKLLAKHSYRFEKIQGGE
ncbi:RNase H family protein [Clostridium sp. HBUAS56010]|uniref:RNase H family protein n=1 Tax=Clostridium sp. HBUAS56010 TaxID=2571127 RepID=UPI00117825AC|nr:RNase H family protein [Clostridium sp. HBUAS56010]